ncbi:hypothetical protein AHAS_Ahas16G0152700 [Arachis hypogaea]
MFDFTSLGGKVSKNSDARVYNHPSCDEVAALVIGDFDSFDYGHDINVKSRSGELQRISETHALYWPLLYPLLFPYGEYGYQLGIPYRRMENVNVVGRRTRVSLREFVCFRLQMREYEENLFLTPTCNPNWPEFQRYTDRERISIANRPDISCQVFHAKMKCLLVDLREGIFFGPLNADGKCSKFYPKRFVVETSFDEDGYPIYKRRDMGVTVNINGVDIDNRNKDLMTMFIAWMVANRRYVEARALTYVEFPSKFIYDHDSREWKPRQRGFLIGRLSFAHPSVGELFYMRLLLNVQRDHNEFVSAIKEVAELSSGAQLRKFFVTLLQSGSISRPSVVWNQTWMELSDDIIFSRRRELQFPELRMTEDDIQNLCLLEIEKLLQLNGKSLKDFVGMPYPKIQVASEFNNAMMLRGLQYDLDLMVNKHETNVQNLNEEQKVVYDRIMHYVNNREHVLFFIYGFGGTGKTFLYRVLSARLRSERRIVINVSSSGIASLLLPGSKTAHSMFGISIDLNEDSVCKISKDSAKTDLIRSAELIIWDEAPMTNKLAFEALDRTFS